MKHELDQVKQWLLALKQGDNLALQPLLDLYTNPETREEVRERIRDAMWLDEGMRDAVYKALIPKWDPPGVTLADFLRWILRRPNPHRAAAPPYTADVYERELLAYSILDGYLGPYDTLEIVNKMDKQAQLAGIDIQPIKSRIAAISSPAFRYWLLRQEPYIQYRDKWERTPPDA